LKPVLPVVSIFRHSQWQFFASLVNRSLLTMRVPRQLLGGLLFLFFYTPVQAQTPVSALRGIPAAADLVVEIKNPREIHDLLMKLDLVKDVLKFSATQEFLQSTRARRFFQLVHFFERELGAKYPDLLDQLSGGGIAAGLKFGPNPAPALLVIQGRDEKLTRHFVELVVKLIEEELQRAESREKLTRSVYHGVDILQLGPELRVATVGATIVIANQDKMLHDALDLLSGSSTKSLADLESVRQAQKLLPHDVLAWLWLNMETVHKMPGAKAFFQTPRDAFFTVQIGSYLDVLGRSPFVAAGIRKTADGLWAGVRLPRGREGLGAEKVLHMPTDSQKPGSRPLLAPRGVLYSYSFYLDLPRIWEDRAKLFPAAGVKALEKFNQDSGQIPMAGMQLSKLLTQAGSYHRFVAVNQPRAAYKKQPRTPIPAFALVTEMRDPQFAKSLETVLRGGAFLATTQVALKLEEVTYKDCKIVGYRFSEDQPLKKDVNDIRFNFSPCFTHVCDQFVICSTMELCRELIDLLQAEEKAPGKPVAATSRQRIFASGIADVFALFQDQLITQAILDRAIPATEARKQVQAFLDLVRRQGAATIEIAFLPRELHLDVKIQSQGQGPTPKSEK
jgi:hypothetical protein